MPRNLVLSTILFLTTTAATAQTTTIMQAGGKKITSADVDRIVKKLIDTADVAGACIGIINNNRVVYTKGYGYKNKALGTFNDTATCFYAASLAKPLFGYLVMQLVDEGLIDLDRPVYKYLPKPLPEYDNYKDLAGDDRWKLITPRQCLDHTTGFPNWREFNQHGTNKLEILFTPGREYSYSGEGIMLLQLVVETVTHRKLEDLAQEKIFKPFGMRRTSFLWQPAFETDYAVGHDMNTDTMPKVKRMDLAAAAGSMETTVADYSRFMSAVMQGNRLTAKSWNEMLSPQIKIFSKRQIDFLPTDTSKETMKAGLSYGLGWGLFNSPYGKAFFKEGKIYDWVNYVIGIPEKKIALVILVNSASGESIFKELVEKLIGVTIPWEWENYIPYRATVRLPVQTLQQYAGVYDGRLKAIVYIDKGRLKVKSPTVNLPPTNLYAQNDHHFFLKIMETDIEFVKGADGKIEKAVLDDEGEHYELKKVSDDPGHP